MFLFEPSNYGELVSRLLAENRKCALGPGTPNPAVYALLADAKAVDVVPDARYPELAACCLSGLWLWHDYLDESHEISQDLHSAEGSYWHGIMHRREPDYSNAKYWYRRVGDHPIFPALLDNATLVAAEFDLDEPARALLNKSSWDPDAFVDLCADVARGRSTSRDSQSFCQEIATLEWQLLFDHCFRLAGSDSTD